MCAVNRGFTLLELMVVMAIMSLLLVMSGPSINSLNDSLEYRESVRLLTSAHQKARRAARSSGVAVDVVIDAQRNRFAVTGEPRLLQENQFASLPENLKIDVVYAQEVSPGNGLAAIRFYPEGGASGGEVLIRRPSGAGVKLIVDWLIGDVRRESL
jgi:general secretion pathway protein H